MYVLSRNENKNLFQLLQNGDFPCGVDVGLWTIGRWVRTAGTRSDRLCRCCLKNCYAERRTCVSEEKPQFSSNLVFDRWLTVLDCDYKRSRIVICSPHLLAVWNLKEWLMNLAKRSRYFSDIISIDLKQSAICFYLILNSYDTPFKQMSLPWSILIKQRTTRHCLYIYIVYMLTNVSI